MLADDLRSTFLTSGLSERQHVELLAAGQETPFKRGDELFREGEPADFLWILLEGQIQLVRGSVNETVVLATMSTPGQWAGGLRAWGDASSSAGFLRDCDRRPHVQRSPRSPADSSEWFVGGHTSRPLPNSADQAAAPTRVSGCTGTPPPGWRTRSTTLSCRFAVEALRQTCDQMLLSSGSCREGDQRRQFVSWTASQELGSDQCRRRRGAAMDRKR